MRGLIKPRDSKLIFRVKILPEKSTDHQIWYLILMPGQFSTCKRPPIKKGYSLQLLVSISDPVNGFIKISAILRCDFICCTSKLLALSQTSHLKHCWNLWNVWILEPKNELKTARKIFCCCTSELLVLSQTTHLKHWNLWNVWILEPKNELKTARKICSLFFRSVFFFNNTDMSYFLSAMTNCGAFFICFFCGFYPGKKALTHACDVQFNHN